MEEKGYYTLRELIENDELRKKYLSPIAIEKTLGRARNVTSEHLKDIVENTQPTFAQKHWLITIIISCILSPLVVLMLQQTLLPTKVEKQLHIDTVRVNGQTIHDTVYIKR